MRQLIARLDDDLHALVKERAAQQGVSVNSWVSDVLSGAVGATDRRQVLRARARALGLLVEPPPPERVPGWDEVLRATAGAGDAASRALDDDRGPW